MKLISMTDFVLAQKEKLKNSVDGFNIEKYGFIINTCEYANFLKQPLELWMFVPCKLVDDVWVVFAFEPEMVSKERVFLFWNGVFQNKNEYIKEYQKAKERCLFEGFEIDEYKKLISNKFIGNIYSKGFNKKSNEWFKNIQENTVEDLVKYDLQLTKTAIKQLGL